jgi:hypothetical protein
MCKKMLLVLVLGLASCAVEPTFTDPVVEDTAPNQASPPGDYDSPTPDTNICGKAFANSVSGIPVPVLCDPFYFEKGRPIDDNAHSAQPNFFDLPVTAMSHEHDC